MPNTSVERSTRNPARLCGTLTPCRTNRAERKVSPALPGVAVNARVVVFAGVAMLAYGTQALVFAWFCRIVGTGVSVADCVLIFVQATLFGAASMLPGGLGAMEAALVLQLIERGVDNGGAVSLAISSRLVTLWVGMSLGALCLLFSSSKDLETE